MPAVCNSPALPRVMKSYEELTFLLKVYLYKEALHSSAPDSRPPYPLERHVIPLCSETEQPSGLMIFVYFK